jgi:hypothetical protein
MGYSTQKEKCWNSKRRQGWSIAVSSEATQITRTEDTKKKEMKDVVNNLCHAFAKLLTLVAVSGRAVCVTKCEV